MNEHDDMILKKQRSEDALIDIVLPEGIDKRNYKWNAPIDIIQAPPIIEEVSQRFGEKIDDEIIKVIYRYGIEVDAKELERALRYDRNQYTKGYRDGYMAAEEKMIKRKKRLLASICDLCDTTAEERLKDELCENCPITTLIREAFDHE